MPVFPPGTRNSGWAMPMVFRSRAKGTRPYGSATLRVYQLSGICSWPGLLRMIRDGSNCRRKGGFEGIGGWMTHVYTKLPSSPVMEKKLFKTLPSR